ncbi:MAG TPA: pyrroline-5-carboxylate reductase [Pirellulaceae bacterium]|nr:pyrroline-5-carboxylate reductase [Pirellulaceae bacterium]HMO90939.1 pyrroline-5-carboxylate reductase [Pirellulaceae bacterium]HMP69838.1 pyrroline-5-carboxylate reductase [Pirellulaceae bacterium]
MEFEQLGFVGAGKMALAIAKGLAQQKLIRAEQITIYDPSSSAVDAFKQALGDIKVASNVNDVHKSCSTIVLAVKPQVVESALAALDPPFDPSPLWVSVVAGVSLARLHDLTHSQRVIRVMPNTPCLVGHGASAISTSPGTQERDTELVAFLFGLIGKVLVVPERMLDAVTGLSGSGPAYVFTFIEALVEGGVLVGLPREESEILAVQTVLGSVLLLLEEKKSPAELRAMVTSPGGTTISGLKALEDGRFRATVMEAVAKATRRAGELGTSSQGET